ncbi:MAG: NADH-quinone oxidoreductase subunit J [Acidimicrobiia bacterium]
MEVFVFIVSAAVILTGALGVILRSNPVHAALSLVQTLFGIAVLFIAQNANFLAAVQVIVYAGAIVVLFLFVIMLLGVDKAEDLRTDPLGGQRPLAAVAGVGFFGLIIASIVRGADVVTGERSVGGPLETETEPNLTRLAKSLFTDYVFAFEVTSALLVIAVVGAVILARRPDKPGSGKPSADKPGSEKRASR